MRLPNVEAAEVLKAKVCDYLLSPSHPAGRAKARWFLQLGFAVESWEVLAAALKRHAGEHAVAAGEDSPFGVRYTVEGPNTVEGPMDCPGGPSPPVRSVWFVESGGTVPRFVTAYPLKRSRT